MNLLCREHAPHGYEERHGEVGEEAVIDAERYVTLAHGLRDDGQCGVHGDEDAGQRVIIIFLTGKCFNIISIFSLILPNFPIFIANFAN